MRMKLVEDSDYQMLFVGPAQSTDPQTQEPQIYANGDMVWYPFIKVLFLEEYSGFEHKYLVEVGGVSPGMLKFNGKLEEVIESCGMDEKFNDEMREHPENFIVDIVDYGFSMTFWQEQGNNLRHLLKEAHNQLKVISFMSGFYMDKHQNSIGTTGWELMRGDILAGINRYSEVEQ